jgi:hypothetical protein
LHVKWIVSMVCSRFDISALQLLIWFLFLFSFLFGFFSPFLYVSVILFVRATPGQKPFETHMAASGLVLPPGWRQAKTPAGTPQPQNFDAHACVAAIVVHSCLAVISLARLVQPLLFGITSHSFRKRGTSSIILYRRPIPYAVFVLV